MKKDTICPSTLISRPESGQGLLYKHCHNQRTCYYEINTTYLVFIRVIFTAVVVISKDRIFCAYCYVPSIIGSDSYNLDLLYKTLQKDLCYGINDSNISKFALYFHFSNLKKVPTLDLAMRATWPNSKPDSVLLSVNHAI